MKKKIGLILSVMLVFICCIMVNTKCVKAAENDVKVGQGLNKPKEGWKRYDDRDNNIKYFGKWEKDEHCSTYNGTQIILNKSQANKGDNFCFNFVGDKFMILCDENALYNHSKWKVIIDNQVVDLLSTQNVSDNNMNRNIVTYIKEGLAFKEHSVKIELDSFEDVFYRCILLTAIDINDNGELKPYEENKEIKAESITLDKTSMDLLEGSSDKITSTVLPDDATNKKVIWSSSDESIAKVDENGNVTAIKEGQATITAKVENTDLTATCKVNVTKPVEENKNNAILSISLVNGATKEYDVSMEEVDKFINWFEERSSGNGPSLYSFDKKISPYKSVKEYIVHDKIASFEVREYEATK